MTSVKLPQQSKLLFRQNVPSPATIAVVIPSFRVRKHILPLLTRIGPEVAAIYVVDDCCPENTGATVLESCEDHRVKVLFHEENRGVGAAVLTGYGKAIEEGHDVIVKIDGDGQMDPALILNFVEPILDGQADYTKGNRFFDLESLSSMPRVRLLGNAVLSFLTKFSSGYWSLFDPTNGYTAIHSNVARILPFEKISRRYYFETDMLFRLNTYGAVVIDIPMTAVYADETSSLKISKVAGEFLLKHLRNTCKRIFYNYYLRDMSVASFELPAGLLLLLFGGVFGSVNWVKSIQTGSAAPLGTIMLSALSVLIGIQFILAFLAYDIAAVPRRPIHRGLRRGISESQ